MKNYFGNKIPLKGLLYFQGDICILIRMFTQ